MPSPSAAPYPKTAPVGRSKSDVSLMRDKNGCITCRVRQKKCNGFDAGNNSCSDCSRLNIQCLGVQHNRPDWLRNPEALKETKYRIKHHLTEHPVPRGRGPAPPRPFLSFQDLIDKYSPPRIPVGELLDAGMKSGHLRRMEPESPTHTHSYAGPYLTVQTSHYASPATPSPSSSYATTPCTPPSSDGNLFVCTDVKYNYSAAMMPQDSFEQADSTYFEMPYVPQHVPQTEQFGQMLSPLQSPYRYAHSESLFLTSPVSMYPNEYLSGHISPSARRQ